MSLLCGSYILVLVNSRGYYVAVLAV